MSERVVLQSSDLQIKECLLTCFIAIANEEVQTVGQSQIIAYPQKQA